MRWFIYTLFLITNILISLDHGSIPASTSQLRQFVHSDQVIGLFGSFVFVGNILGSLISFWIINTINRKTLLELCLFLLFVCLITFTCFTNICFLFLNRLFVGIFQSYITIYLPVWCNQFGIRSKKSLMITFGQIVVPIGVFLGYWTASIFIQGDRGGRWVGWKLAFVIQGCGVAVLGLVFLFIPSVYFDSYWFSVRSNSMLEEYYPDQTFFTVESYDNTLSKQVDSEVHGFNSHNNNNNYANTNTESDLCSLWRMFRVIVKNKVFTACVWAWTSLFFVITGVQYWVGDYMEYVWNVASSKERLLYFTIVCFTSPTWGVFSGGCFMNVLGGYEGKTALKLCFVWAVLALLSAALVPVVSNITVFVSWLWLVLFFGGGVLPAITGVILATLPKKYAASGNSVTIFLSNLFGYLPAPYIYGAFTDYFNDKGIRGMCFTMWYSVVGVVLIGVAMVWNDQGWEGERQWKKEGNYTEGVIETGEGYNQWKEAEGEDTEITAAWLI